MHCIGNHILNSNIYKLMKYQNKTIQERNNQKIKKINNNRVKNHYHHYKFKLFT